jgi:hypothetical protein
LSFLLLPPLLDGDTRCCAGFLPCCLFHMP